MSELRTFLVSLDFAPISEILREATEGREAFEAALDEAWIMGKSSNQPIETVLAKGIANVKPAKVAKALTDYLSAEQAHRRRAERSLAAQRRRMGR